MIELSEGDLIQWQEPNGAWQRGRFIVDKFGTVVTCFLMPLARLTLSGKLVQLHSGTNYQILGKRGDDGAAVIGEGVV